MATTGPASGSLTTGAEADPAHPTPIGNPLPGSGAAIPAPALLVDDRLFSPSGITDGTAVVHGLRQGAVRVGGLTPNPLRHPERPSVHLGRGRWSWPTRTGAPTADFRQPSSTAGGGLAGLAMNPGGPARPAAPQTTCWSGPWPTARAAAPARAWGHPAWRYARQRPVRRPHARHRCRRHGPRRGPHRPRPPAQCRRSVDGARPPRAHLRQGR
jgi:hypothetical protein